MNVDNVYNIVKEAFKDFDAIYEDYLIYLVGFEGFYILKENRLLESCGVINGRKLYALCDKK